MIRFSKDKKSVLITTNIRNNCDYEDFLYRLDEEIKYYVISTLLQYFTVTEYKSSKIGIKIVFKYPPRCKDIDQKLLKIIDLAKLRASILTTKKEIRRIKKELKVIY